MLQLHGCWDNRIFLRRSWQASMGKPAGACETMLQVTHMLAGCCTVTTTPCVRLEANGVPMHTLHTTGYLRHRRKTVQAGKYCSSTQDSTNVLAGWCPSHLQSYSNRWRRAFRVLGTWSCQWLCLWHLPYRPDYVQSGNKLNQINRGFKMSLQLQSGPIPVTK